MLLFVMFLETRRKETRQETPFNMQKYMYNKNSLIFNYFIHWLFSLLREDLSKWNRYEGKKSKGD